MPDSEGLVSQDSYLEVSLESSGSYEFEATGSFIKRLVGSFVDDGIGVGDRITSDNGSNPGSLTVTVVTALQLTVAEAVVDSAAAATVLTVFVPVGEVQSMTTPAGEPSEIDMSHLRSTSREFRNGLRDEGSVSGEMNFVPSDRGQQLMVEMQAEKTGRKVAITVPPVDDGAVQLDGYRWTFTGLVRGMPVSLAVDEKATRSFTIRVSGTPDEAVITA